MDLELVEAEAGALLGPLADEDRVHVGHLVERHLGEGAIQAVPAAALPADACIATVRGRQKIYVREGTPATRSRWAVAHELAEWHLGRLGYREADREETANALAAAVLAPHRPFASQARVLTMAELALRFGVTESTAVLRVGEVTGQPLALVARRLRVRGDGYVWPTEEELRRIARAERLPAGLLRLELNEARRVALLAS